MEKLHFHTILTLYSRTIPELEYKTEKDENQFKTKGPTFEHLNLH